MGSALSTLWNFVWGSRPPARELTSSPSPPGESNPPPVPSTMAGASTSNALTASGLAEEAKVNNTVWELYSPGDDYDTEIIFFHGLQVGDHEEAYWKTWLSTDETVIWPREWLQLRPELRCHKARTLSVSYNSSATFKKGEDPLEMYALGENLVEDIIHDAECGQKPGRPVILVGHCLGGIVIKQFILSAIRLRDQKAVSNKQVFKRIDKFLNNFKGAFFYATPNGGSPVIEDWAKKLKNPRTPLLRLLKVLGTETQRINEEFRDQRHGNIEARTFAIFEKNFTISPEFNALIVPEASARQDIDGAYHNEGSDHFTVCKAKSKEDSTVIGKLAKFTKDIMAAQEEEHEELTNLRRLEDLRTFQQARESVPTTSSSVSTKTNDIQDAICERK